MKIELNLIRDTRKPFDPWPTTASEAAELFEAHRVVAGELRDWLQDQRASEGAVSRAAAVAGTDTPPAPTDSASATETVATTTVPSSGSAAAASQLLSELLRDPTLLRQHPALRPHVRGLVAHMTGQQLQASQAHEAAAAALEARTRATEAEVEALARQLQQAMEGEGEGEGHEAGEATADAAAASGSEGAMAVDGEEAAAPTTTAAAKAAPKTAAAARRGAAASGAAASASSAVPNLHADQLRLRLHELHRQLQGLREERSRLLAEAARAAAEGRRAAGLQTRLEHVLERSARSQRAQEEHSRRLRADLKAATARHAGETERMRRDAGRLARDMGALQRRYDTAAASLAATRNAVPATAVGGVVPVHSSLSRRGSAPSAAAEGAVHSGSAPSAAIAAAAAAASAATTASENSAAPVPPPPQRRAAVTGTLHSNAVLGPALGATVTRLAQGIDSAAVTRLAHDGVAPHAAGAFAASSSRVVAATGAPPLDSGGAAAALQQQLPISECELPSACLHSRDMPLPGFAEEDHYLHAHHPHQAVHSATTAGGDEGGPSSQRRIGGHVFGSGHAAGSSAFAGSRRRGHLAGARRVSALVTRFLYLHGNRALLEEELAAIAARVHATGEAMTAVTAAVAASTTIGAAVAGSAGEEGSVALAPAVIAAAAAAGLSAEALLSAAGVAASDAAPPLLADGATVDRHRLLTALARHRAALEVRRRACQQQVAALLAAAQREELGATRAASGRLLQARMPLVVPPHLARAWAAADAAAASVSAQERTRGHAQVAAASGAAAVAASAGAAVVVRGSGLRRGDGAATGAAAGVGPPSLSLYPSLRPLESDLVGWLLGLLLRQTVQAHQPQQLQGSPPPADMPVPPLRAGGLSGPAVAATSAASATGGHDEDADEEEDRESLDPFEEADPSIFDDSSTYHESAPLPSGLTIGAPIGVPAPTRAGWAASAEQPQPGTIIVTAAPPQPTAQLPPMLQRTSSASSVLAAAAATPRLGGGAVAPVAAGRLSIFKHTASSKAKTVASAAGVAIAPGDVAPSAAAVVVPSGGAPAALKPIAASDPGFFSGAVSAVNRGGGSVGGTVALAVEQRNAASTALARGSLGVDDFDILPDEATGAAENAQPATGLLPAVPLTSLVAAVLNTQSGCATRTVPPPQVPVAVQGSGMFTRKLTASASGARQGTS